MRSEVKRSAVKSVLRGYGAAGACSSVGNAAGPFSAGWAIVVAGIDAGVVSVDVEPMFMPDDVATDA
jgi:hypothetical protein